jgi:C1A family cysteine protease
MMIVRAGLLFATMGHAVGPEGYFLMPYAYLTNHRLSSDFWSANRIE